MILALTLWAVAAVAAASSPAAAPPAVYSAFAFGARGDGKANDTAAIQRTIDAACATRGVALLPANGTFLLGGGMNALGHAYDGVTLRIEGNVTIPVDTHWSTAAECGVASHWRDCHFADALSPSLLNHLLKVEGGAVE